MKEVIKKFNKNNIEYCFIESKENCNYIFVHPRCKSTYKELMIQLGYKKQESAQPGVRYIYKLHPEELWSKAGYESVMVSFQMSCSSLSNLMNAKLPLDSLIQDSIWKNKIIDAK